MHSKAMWPTVSQHHNRLHKRPNARIKVGHYHTLPMSKGNLYQAIRKRLKMTRVQFSEYIGISTTALRYRERVKRMYHMCEILALLQASGMTTEEFAQLLNDIA
jgi:DNA-binding transcriptional regulator YiaG